MTNSFKLPKMDGFSWQNSIDIVFFGFKAVDHLVIKTAQYKFLIAFIINSKLL